MLSRCSIPVLRKPKARALEVSCSPPSSGARSSRDNKFLGARRRGQCGDLSSTRVDKRLETRALATPRKMLEEVRGSRATWKPAARAARRAARCKTTRSLSAVASAHGHDLRIEARRMQRSITVPRSYDETGGPGLDARKACSAGSLQSVAECGEAKAYVGGFAGLF